MKEKSHPKVRNELRSNGFYLWELGPILGVSEQTITRLMRKKLTDDEEAEIIAKIREAAHERATS